ncbi:MAG TPA: twin-arginine translocase TatA/TatE family subunit [Gammaproteobacteria bacterium]|jgi:sec-independent protein translocase protein TatA
MEFSFGKLILLLVIILLLLGSSKIPKIGQDLGTAIRNFKKSSSDSEAKTTEVSKNDKNGS